ncbi:ATP-dependent DNA helicase [Candidatus Micrarchaeota archaeon]|nr:ATP-dependent DNA helicase [Candidatus Micrarchaeota archaeon]
MDYYFRHDRVRPHQKELMDDIYSAVSGGGNIMVQAPTGLGKTDAALSASLTYALENNLTVFFLTPKISQHKIAMEVVKGIEAKHKLGIKAVDMVGRSHSCTISNLCDLDNDSFQATCGRLRKNKQCIPFINARGYNTFQEHKADLRFRKMLESYGSGLSHHELLEFGKKSKCCVYEWMLMLASSADVIIADYYHMMVPHIRDIFLMKTKKRIEDSIIIIDEAHNLSPRIRSSLSRSINTFTFKKVTQEMDTIGRDAGPISDGFAAWGEETLSSISANSPGQNASRNEKAISGWEFQAFIEQFGLPMEEITDLLVDAGVSYVDETSKKSACLNLAKFLSEWKNDEFKCVRILKKKNNVFFLSKRVLDPSCVTGILNQCTSSVLMSGTLIPMEMHLDVLGLDKARTTLKHYPSPFDNDNIVNIITENLTTKYSRRDEAGYSAIASKLDSIVDVTPGGTAIFFPSYDVMNNILPLVKNKRLLIQRSGMNPLEIRTILKQFKSGGVLCGVQGGSFSEGVDFCDSEIKTIVIVGVALEEMNAEIRALIDYYDEKFGRGWDYGYLYPGTIKALQAAGRARRKESDRVSVVYMDERFKWNKYNWVLNKDERIIVTTNPEDEVGKFWSKTIR